MKKILEEDYKYLLDFAEDIIQSVDSDGRFLYVNSAWKNKLGYTDEEIKTLTFIDIISPEHKENCKKVFMELHQSPTSKRVETEFISKFNKSFFVDGRINTKFENDRLTETIGIFRDITQSKKDSEELKKISKIYEQSPSLIILTDSSGKIEYVNPKFCEVTGYSKEEVLGKNPKIIQSGETRSEVYEDLWKTVKSKLTWKGELLNKKKNGEKYWAGVSIFPILDDFGEIISLIGIQEDITSKKKSEEEITLFEKMAVDRELKMIELKKEINDLLTKNGQKERYI